MATFISFCFLSPSGVFYQSSMKGGCELFCLRKSAELYGVMTWQGGASFVQMQRFGGKTCGGGGFETSFQITKEAEKKFMTTDHPYGQFSRLSRFIIASLILLKKAPG